MQAQRRFGQVAASGAIHLGDRHAQLVADHLHPELHRLVRHLEKELVRVDESLDGALAGEQRLGIDEFFVVGESSRHAITIAALSKEDPEMTRTRSVVLLCALVCLRAMAAAQAPATADDRPTNDLPTPYRTIENFFKL